MENSEVSNKWNRDNWTLQEKKEHLPKPNNLYKILPKIDHKYKTIKLLEKNTWDNPQDLGLGKELLDSLQKNKLITWTSSNEKLCFIENVRDSTDGKKNICK